MPNSRSCPWFRSNFGRGSWKHAGTHKLDSCWMRWCCNSVGTKLQCHRLLLVLFALLPDFKLASLAALQCTAFRHLWQVWFTHWYRLVTPHCHTRSRLSCFKGTATRWRLARRCVQHRYSIFIGLVADWDISNWWRWRWHLGRQRLHCSNMWRLIWCRCL